LKHGLGFLAIAGKMPLVRFGRKKGMRMQREPGKNRESDMAIIDGSADASLKVRENFATYLVQPGKRPLFVVGDAYQVLRALPENSVDCCMTSPPYWGHRQYSKTGIGLEKNLHEYVSKLIQILIEVKRVLKPTGSLWLNLGDSYVSKGLMGVPWRVALKLVDEIGYILRNSVIWHKIKGAPDNSSDKLRCVHENLFHLVKFPQYFYDIDAIRAAPRKAKIENGRVISATGVSGIRYKRQIELSTALSHGEKTAAAGALDAVLNSVRKGEISDFRMVIRGTQRVTHSDGIEVSGRARELRDKGFYFLKYHPNGMKPGDVWDILPEDTQNREGHYAAYPIQLCMRPILLTCPSDGVVLDPFCGTGTTMRAAQNLSRKSIGIDISEQYIALATQRCGLL
jgi:site-specific DNA-methyltransferase (adenine-specific)